MIARLWRSLALTPLVCSCHQAAPAVSVRAEVPSPGVVNSEQVPKQALPMSAEPAPPAPRPASLANSRPHDTRDPASIQKVLTDNRSLVRVCYDESLKTNPGIAGDLVVRFVIHADGSVKSAEVNWPESDIHIPELETCVLEQVREYVFPASSRGMETRVNYPYNFNPNR